MKKIICFLVCLSGCFISKGQWSLNIEAGYMFGTDFDNHEQASQFYVNSGQESVQVILSSFGKGVNINSGLFYKMNPNLALGMNVSYLYGIRIKQSNINDLTGEDYFIGRSRGNMLRVAPTVRLMFDLKKVNFFTEIGIMAGLFGDIVINSEDVDGGDIEKMKEKYFGDIPIGISTKTGIIFPFGDHYRLILGFGSYLHAFGPTKSKIISYTENGEDIIDELEYFEAHSIYVKEEIYTTGSGAFDPDKPGTRILKYYPFGSTGFSIGVQFNIGKKKKLDPSN